MSWDGVDIMALMTFVGPGDVFLLEPRGLTPMPLHLPMTLLGLAAFFIALSPAALASPMLSLFGKTKEPASHACDRPTDNYALKNVAHCIAELLQAEGRLRKTGDPSPNAKYLEQLKKIIDPTSVFPLTDKSAKAIFFRTSLSAAVSSLEKYFAAKSSGKSGALLRIPALSGSRRAEQKASEEAFEEAFLLAEEHYDSIRTHTLIFNTLFQAPDLLQINHDPYTYQAHLIILGSMTLEFSRNEVGVSTPSIPNRPRIS
jgi:hypothetical protein